MRLWLPCALLTVVMLTGCSSTCRKCRQVGHCHSGASCQHYGHGETYHDPGPIDAVLPGPQIDGDVPADLPPAPPAPDEVPGPPGVELPVPMTRVDDDPMKDGGKVKKPRKDKTN